MLKAVRFAFILSLVLLCPFWTMAELRVDFNQKCLAAQQSIYQLRLDEAQTILTAAYDNDNLNVAVDYLMVVKSMLSYITNESNITYIQFDSIKNSALDRIATCTELDGYRDFLLEEIYFYSSVVSGKRGNTFSAANDVRNSYKFGTRVLVSYPEFHAAKKTIGLLNSGFGSLPNNYQKLVQFFGYESSMANGILNLNEFIHADESPPEWELMKKEAQFYVASIYLYLKNDKPVAWDLINILTQDYTTNPLSSFARVNFADKCSLNDEIIRVVQNTPTAKPYGSIPFLQFMLGKAKLNRLDTDADYYLLQYLSDYKGKNYVKSCYQKLSWHALLTGQNEDYNKYIELIKTKGNTSLEEDEQAYKYAQSGLT
ncbi:MAG: hypothetical protein ACI9NN_000702, partial [Bacteroidia bacterium]